MVLHNQARDFSEIIQFPSIYYKIGKLIGHCQWSHSRQKRVLEHDPIQPFLPLADKIHRYDSNFR